MLVVYLNYLEFLFNFRFFDNIVYFIDGWFGLWNDNLCEREFVKESLRLIFEERDKKEEKKFVVGLSFEIRKMYVEFFEENEVVFFFLEIIFLDCLLKKKKEKVKIYLDIIKKKCRMDEC